MTTTKMLIGSLSNDLLRVANLTYRGSNTAALKFMIESQRWVQELIKHDTKPYINKIIKDIEAQSKKKLDLEQADKYLMYSTLLQNYSLYIE